MPLGQQFHLAKQEIRNVDEIENNEEKLAKLNLIRADLISLWQENRDIAEMEFMNFLNNSIESLENHIKNPRRYNIKNVKLELNKCLFSLKCSKTIIIQKRYF